MIGTRRSLIKKIQASVDELAQAVAATIFWHDQCLEEANREFQDRKNKAKAHLDETLAAERTTYEALVEARQQNLSEIAPNLFFSPWEEGRWNNFTPGRLDGSWNLSRIGSINVSGRWHTLTAPALIPFIGHHSLLLQVSGEARVRAAQAVQSLLLRLLAAIPPGKLRFTFIDPIGLGQNVAAFMHLADYDESLVTGKVWTEPQHIEQRLADLTEHMENVIQKYLRNQYADIEAYNAQAGEVAEPYRVLVVMNFPANFSETAARRLVSIAQNGPRCGVYCVIMADAGKPLPYGFNMADLEQNCTLIRWDGQRFVWEDDDFRHCLLELDRPPEPELFNRLVKQVGEAAKAAGRVEVPFARVVPPPEQWWAGNGSSGIRVALGPAGARKLQYFDLGKGTAHHALLAGRPGSGKSTLLHVLLGSQTLAGAYSLARSTMDQMAVRIALQCSEADSRLILGDDNPAARLLSRPGEAIYNDANGLVEGNNLFQVAWLTEKERDSYMAEVRRLARERNYRPVRPPIVFEGNAPAHLEQNEPLRGLLDDAHWPPPARRVAAWLGDPIAIKEPTAAHFRRQSASNLLIIGQQEEAAMGILVAGLLSLAAQQPPPAARFYLLDFGAIDAPHAQVFAALRGILPHATAHGRRREVPAIMAEVGSEVQKRLAADAEESLNQQPSLYLLIYGLQRARDLRQEDSFGFSSYSAPTEASSPGPAEHFAKILQEGPDLGVHTLIWCDTLTNLNRILERRLLREFEMRVAFQMSAEDSANVIDIPAASKLGPHRAIFYSEEDGRLEKFRPYALPSEAWLVDVGERLKKRS